MRSPVAGPAACQRTSCVFPAKGGGSEPAGVDALGLLRCPALYCGHMTWHFDSGLVSVVISSWGVL